VEQLPLIKLLRAKYFRICNEKDDSQSIYEPCRINDYGAIEMNYKQVPFNCLRNNSTITFVSKWEV
jgi:hypothetical protein